MVLKPRVVFQMVAPRSLEELAASLEWWDEGTTGEGVEGRVGCAPWPRAFIKTPMMRAAGRERYFLYMVCCAGQRFAFIKAGFRIRVLIGSAVFKSMDPKPHFEPDQKILTIFFTQKTQIFGK